MTVELLSVKKESNGDLRLRLALTDGEKQKTRTLITPEADYIETGSPKPGEFLFPEDYRILARRDDRLRAIDRAYMILGAGDNTKRSLYTKLRQKGFPAEAAHDAVAEMEARGYLREQDYLLRSLAYYANQKLYGKRKLFAACTARGFSAEDIRHAIAAAEESGEIDFAQNKKNLLASHGDLSPEQRKKLLLRYGY